MIGGVDLGGDVVVMGGGGYGIGECCCVDIVWLGGVEVEGLVWIECEVVFEKVFGVSGEMV